MAVAGIILGIVGLILDVILIIFFIAVWHHVTTQFPSPGNSPSFP
jgi:predicted PurR-regulated permease PerM